MSKLLECLLGNIFIAGGYSVEGAGKSTSKSLKCLIGNVFPMQDEPKGKTLQKSLK